MIEKVHFPTFTPFYVSKFDGKERNTARETSVGDRFMVSIENAFDPFISL